eukprot:Skav216313  [mRNA]  locus=scaffold494:315231:319289:- [translate_table: standard]
MLPNVLRLVTALRSSFKCETVQEPPSDAGTASASEEFSEGTADVGRQPSAKMLFALCLASAVKGHALRGMSGVFLACLRPIVNGIIADSTSDDRRGKLFSHVQSAVLIGMCITTLVAGNLANIHVGEVPGWRILFVLSGVLAALITLTIGLMASASDAFPRNSAAFGIL